MRSLMNRLALWARVEVGIAILFVLVVAAEPLWRGLLALLEGLHQ